MIDPPTTRHTLIRRLSDPRDNTAWSEFASQYAPLLYRFARQKGLQDADASDIVQKVFEAVSRHIDRFVPRPNQPSFRRWFFRIARNKVCDHINRISREPKVASELERTVHNDFDESSWLEFERRRNMFRKAAEAVQDSFQPSTWKAFWETAIEGRKPEAVAKELNLTVGAVYIARSRVMAKLRKQIRSWESANSN